LRRATSFKSHTEFSQSNKTTTIQHFNWKVTITGGDGVDPPSFSLEYEKGTDDEDEDEPFIKKEGAASAAGGKRKKRR
jgi:hypothetical protein